MPAMSTDRSVLNFQIRTAPVTSEGVNVPSCRAIFTSLSPTPIGHTGKRYRPIAPDSVLAFGDAMASRTGGTLTYSNLDDGHKSLVFCTLKDPLNISKGKPAMKQLCLVAPNDGDGSLTVAALINDLWCDNQHHVVVGRGRRREVITRIRIRHTDTADALVREATSILDRILPAIVREETTLAALLNRPLTAPPTLQPNSEVFRYYNAIFPQPTPLSPSDLAALPPTARAKADAAFTAKLASINAIHTSMLNSFLADREAGRFPTANALGLLNSATDYIQHRSKIRSTTDRFERNLDGAGYDLTITAQSTALSQFLNN